MIPQASMGPSPAEGRKGVEGSSALPKAELTGSLGRPKNRITFHLTLHRTFILSLPLADRRDWLQTVAQSAGTSWFLYFGRKKTRAFLTENPDTLKHGNCSCFCKTLILYGYSISDAPLKVKTRLRAPSGLTHE